MDVVIRRAELGEVKELQRLNKMLCDNEVEKYDDTVNPDWPYSAEGEKYYHGLVGRANSACWVAVADGGVVGYLIGEVSDSDSWRTIKKEAELSSMFVLEEYRSQSIGESLWEKFLSWAREQGADALKVVASASNEGAIRFYAKHGFKDYDHVLRMKI